MTEPKKAKQQAPVEASALPLDSADDDTGETPMLAVWLSLAAILIAGLYGLYLGTAGKSQPKSDAAATSSYVSPVPTQSARDRTIGGRLA
jgi:hypothetical protein